MMGWYDGNTERMWRSSITASPSLEVTKTASVTDLNGDGNTGTGDSIDYKITIENKGNVTLTD